MGSKEAMVQAFGGENEFLIRVEKSSEDLEAMSKTIQTSLQQQFKDKTLEIRRAEVVGPKVGKDLKKKALWAVGLSFLGILIYVALRFHQVCLWPRGDCCVVSRCHCGLRRHLHCQHRIFFKCFGCYPDDHRVLDQ